MKSIFTIFLTLIAFAVFGQKDFQGKATYISKTTIDLNSFGRGRQMSEAQKKEMSERMKSMFEKTFMLSFNTTTSIYKEDAKLEKPSFGNGRGFRGMQMGGGVKYKNTKEMVALESTEFFGKKFLISDKMEKPNWILGDETKQIGKYTCFKATLLKDADPLDFANMRRRRDKDKDAKNNKKNDSIKTFDNPEIKTVARKY